MQKLAWVTVLLVGACSGGQTVAPSSIGSSSPDGDASAGDSSSDDGTISSDSPGETADAGAGSTDGSGAFEAESDAAADAAGTCASGALCDGKTGLCGPTSTCTASAPCTNALVGLDTNATLSNILTPPACHTGSATRASFDDGAPRSWTDAVNGDPRAACVYKPSGTSAAALRPLVVYLHGSGGSADAIYDSTSLRAKAPTFDITGDTSRPGFVLASDQGRNMTNANGNAPAARHDLYDRDLASPSTNPDIRNLDKLIDDLVAEGGIDRARIFLMGWSNGAFFAQLYGFARYDTPTPGGNRVAAVAVFDGADPYAKPTDADPEGCSYVAPPHVALPVMIVHRACSIVSCDADQRVSLGEPPGFDVESWIARAIATLEHIAWPDGVADKSGTDYEPEMLRYLAAHPHP
jgi:poly(3-hydroxybutyrate) depolymerase